MASLSGFPFRLTPLMAKTLSPMWMAPVLRSEEGEWEEGRGQRYGITPDKLPVYWDADNDASCSRRRRHSCGLSYVGE